MPADSAPRHSDEELLAAVHGRVAAATAVRARRMFAALGAATAVTLLVATGVAVAGNGGDENHSVRALGEVATTTTAPEGTTTSTEAPTTTEAPQPTTPSTTSPPVLHAAPVTTAPARTRTPAATTPPKATQALPVADIRETSPPSMDPARVYVSARATDADSYVSRMTLDWGDGSVATNFDYPLSACQAGPSSQAADANHRYAKSGPYVVRLIVTSVRCDGSDGQTESAETTVTYPSSPPSG